MTHDYSLADAAATAGISRPPVESPRSGIYYFRHPISRRIYIGQAVDVDKRIASHLAGLEGRRHVNLLLQLDYELLQEQGLAFECGILVECARQELDARERELIESHDALDAGYNLAKVGAHGSIYSKRPEIEEARITLCERWSGLSRSLFDQLTRSVMVALIRESHPCDGPHSFQLRPDLLRAVAAECGIEPPQVIAFHRAARSLDLNGLRLVTEQASYRTTFHT